MRRIKIIGAGPGSREYLLPTAIDHAQECDLLLGSGRALELFSDLHIEMIGCSGRLYHYKKIIKDEAGEKRVGVVVTGDPGFYSLLAFLRREFSKEELEVIPGISSIQYLFSKIATPWQDYRLLSFHGRQISNLEEILAQSKGVTLLTDSKMNPGAIARELVDTPYRDYRAIVGENLSYPEENINIASIKEIANKDDFQMSVMVIDNEW